MLNHIYNSGGQGGRGGGGGGDRPTITLSDHCNGDNRSKCLLLKNLPFRIKEEEIVEFFEGYDGITQETVFIEQASGRRTGAALVVFQSEEVAQDAKDALHRQDLGGRKALLLDQHDDEMQSACGLE